MVMWISKLVAILVACSARASAFVPCSAPHQRLHRSATAIAAATAGARFPDFIPKEVAEIQEPACLDFIRAMQRKEIRVPTSVAPAGTVDTAYVATSRVKGPASTAAPMLFLHGFDSSCLEFRRIFPALQALGAESYAMDILGWGFTQVMQMLRSVCMHII
jgi:hypothetical protein